MWTSENRGRYSRDGLRYPSNLTDAEWAEVEPAIPPALSGGNKRTIDIGEVVNGVMYVPATGCQWRHPQGFTATQRGKRGACIDPHGFDAGKKINGRKRHIVVDMTGLMLHAIVHAADIQDRDGGMMLMATPFGLYPFLLKLYADGGHQRGAMITRCLGVSVRAAASRHWPGDLHAPLS
jgi:hypothetical protein